MPINLGISGNSNETVKLATGDFIVLLDHDDALADFAFYEIVKPLNQQPDLDFIYSDKDCISENDAVRSRLLLKPQWSPEILYSANYLTHLCVIRHELMTAIGGFRSETDGAQDWDLFLRVGEKTSRIARTEGILYHWRVIQGSTSLGIESKPYALAAQLQAVQSHLSRSGLRAMATSHPECGFQVHWAIPAATATILVDGDVDWSVLVQCLSSLSSTLDPALHRVYVVLPAASDRAHQHEKSALEQAFSVPIAWITLNTATSNTAALKLHLFAEAAKRNPADVITVVSGQISRFQNGWIQELSGWVMGHPAMGFVSAIVLTETYCIVEAGLVVDRDGNGSPLMRWTPSYTCGEFGGHLWYRNCSASSPWAVTFQHHHYLKVGGLPTDERSLQHAIIKLCQAVCIDGKRGLVNPHARVFLKEMPHDDMPEFHPSLADDPYFHPAFGSVVPLKLKVKDGKRWGILARLKRVGSRVKRLGGRLKRLGSPKHQEQPVQPQPVEPPQPQPRAELDSYTREAMTYAGVLDFSDADIAVAQQHPERVKSQGPYTVNWYLPSFENAFYGGVMTILRTADHFLQSGSMHQRFLIYTHGNMTPLEMKALIVKAFPRLEASDVLILNSPDAIALIPPSDFSIATLWSTAYLLLKTNNTGLKFYFVQDFEPLFYPAGSMYAQAEATYRFGFYGIANTISLQKVYESDYGGKAVYFTPCVDPSVFYPEADGRKEAVPKQIFFYGRPGHPRNGFELAIEAMKRLKQRYGSTIRICSAGANWNPEDYGMGGVIENLGLLDYQKTGELYRSCHVGLSMMMTQHPSYLPSEMMACGMLVVSNLNSSNNWLLHARENCLLTHPSATRIAETIAEAIDHYDELACIRKNAIERIQTHHADWSTELETLHQSILAFERKTSGVLMQSNESVFFGFTRLTFGLLFFPAFLKSLSNSFFLASPEMTG